MNQPDRAEQEQGVWVVATMPNPRNDEPDRMKAEASKKVVLWPHETQPGRCIHWPKTCAEVQAQQTTYAKPCAHCAPSLYEVPAHVDEEACKHCGA